MVRRNMLGHRATRRGRLQAIAVAMGFTASAAAIVLEGLQDPDGLTYLGEPLAEIAGLVTATAAAARTAAGTGEDVACPGTDCVGSGLTFVRAWDDLGEQYAAWAPYL